MEHYMALLPAGLIAFFAAKHKIEVTVKIKITRK
jgi:hypothetical protein